MTQQRKNLLAIILFAIASFAWGAHGLAAVKPAEQPVEGVPCYREIPDPNDNCAKKMSCEEIFGCRKYSSGSLFSFNNQIPACKDIGRNCPDVRCWYRTYPTRDCTGPYLSEGSLNRQGCRTTPYARSGGESQ